MIDIQNLHFGYRKARVFEGLNLHLQGGHIYGLLGKNGTGKSTLLRNIAGLLFPDSGSVSVMGLDPSKREPSFLNQVFLVAEEFFVPHLRPARFMEILAPFYPRFDKGYFAQLMTDFEIPQEHSLHQMSYGQKKKVLISMALASGAAIILMDEPTNGLDIISKSQFRKVLAGTADENKCIIISTHQVRDLENLIDRITIIDDGKILFDQTLESIQSRLSFRISFDSEETRTALYSENSLKGHALVVPNTTGEEGKVDLELLYKAIVLNRPAVLSAFPA